MPDEKIVINYSGNSHSSKQGKVKPEPEEKQPKIEKVIEGEVIERKKPLGRKIAETFAGDDMRSVGNFILMDVLIPAAKTMISDAMSQGVERMLFGDSRPRSGMRPSYTPYNRLSSPTSSTRSPFREDPRAPLRREESREIILPSRGEALEVLDQLRDIVDQYDFASVSALYSLVGITGRFTDEKWGWTDLRGANIRRVREGYLLDLPRPTAGN
jgi:hypothetical protein